MSDQELSLTIRLRNEAAAQLKQLNQQLGENQKNWQQNFAAISKDVRAASIALAGFGAVTVGALGMAVKAAEEERIGIARLGAQLKNVGVDDDDVKSSIEGVIQATMQKTGVADSEQREALGDLLVVTGNYKRALDLLPLALDLAAAKQMSVRSAAELLGRVAQGNVSILQRYGFQMKEGATAAEALAMVQERVAGTAEATASPIKILQANVGELGEQVGGILLPAVNNLVTSLTPMVAGIVQWSTAHQGLSQGVVGTVAVLGTLALGLGGLGLAIPKLIAGFQALRTVLHVVQVTAIATNAALGPAGWVAIAAGAVVGALALSDSFGNTAQKADEMGVAIKNVSREIAGMTVYVLKNGESLRGTAEDLAAMGALTQAQIEHMQRWKAAQAGVVDTGKALVDITDASKISIASATLEVEGITYKWQLYTEAEIAAAEAAGKLVERIDPDTVEAMRKAEKATQELYDQADKLRREQDQLTESFGRLIGEIEYEVSLAGKLGITMRDVYTVLLASGMPLERLRELYGAWGEDISNVNALLALQGLTAEEVAKSIEKLTGTMGSSIGGGSGSGAATSELARLMNQYGNIPGFGTSEAFMRAVQSATGSGLDPAVVFNNYYQEWLRSQGLGNGGGMGPANPGGGGFVLPPAPVSPIIPGVSSGSGGLPLPPDMLSFGQTSGHPQAGNVSVTVYVQGSVQAEQDLAATIRDQFYQIKGRTGGLEFG